ncbi:NnrU family protein [Pseudophaeobacter flagellatus]|uniref:NnrU family protein n=1 Tax=Pseudophaeobacter flagellatus TaxID=2899119 RepID=UPI001E3991F6|nr:NnrU family protein [Pseudophaeobacter flagellatus]MCD9148243.1 NnrU family protein [Pseudophaeobacter flagellatus]
MTLLVLGILLWWVAHLFKRLAPGIREPMGNKGKGLVAVALVASIVLMVLGYRSAESYDLALFPPFLQHINNLLMLIALYFTSPGPSKGAIFYKMRHPMLTGFALWAVAHLLVNWDPASFVLFGGLLAWALAEMAVINRAEPNWTPNPKGSIAKDAMFLVASVVLLVVIGYVHGMVGPSPFPGG